MITCKSPSLSLLTVAILTAISAPAFAGYGLKDANRSKIKQDAWECKRCVSDTKDQSQVTLGASWQDGDDNHFANTTGTDNDGGSGFVSGSLSRRGSSGYSLDFNADKLGYDAANARLDVRKPGDYQVFLDYQALARFDTNLARSPYRVQDKTLQLPASWQSAGTTSGMTTLADASPVPLDKKRDRFTLGGDLAFGMLDTEVSYRHETREGATRGSVNLLTNAAVIARPIDDSTDTLDASVSWHNDKILGALKGQFSKYDNDYDGLAFESAYTPTFGAAQIGQMGTDPDNRAFSLGADLQFFEGRQQALMHARYSRFSQDEPLLPATVNGPAPQLPVTDADARVNIKELGISYSNRLNRELSIRAAYDYQDRDNKTPEYLYPQIITDSLVGADASNQQYDRTRQSLKLGAKYRFNRNWLLDSDFQHQNSHYSAVSRDSLRENNIRASLQGLILPSWRIRFIGEVSGRRGDSYQTSTLTGMPNQSNLRQFYLADRDKHELTFVSEHQFERLWLQFNAHKGREDYDESELGLDEVTYTGVGFNGSYPVSEQLSLNGYLGTDWRDSSQTGSSNGIHPWRAVNSDDNTSATFGIEWRNVADKPLTLGLDLGYSNGNSDTEIRQGLLNLYGPYSSTRRNFNAFADYRVSEHLSLRLDWMYEKYTDLDWSTAGLGLDSIPNVILLGDLGHDYNAHYVGLGVSYRW